MEAKCVVSQNHTSCFPFLYGQLGRTNHPKVGHWAQLFSYINLDLHYRDSGFLGRKRLEEEKNKKMSSEKVDRAMVLILLLIVVSALSVCTAGGRELAHQKNHKDHSAGATKKGTTASVDMVKTNDYGRYDPTPAFSKPRFKLIPN
ncbi:hypothetical protein BS78_05G140700 [Paspalum vaginatum]|nr:hypothetical protein BS78_05G140700 [Paspalum vaginatum]